MFLGVPEYLVSSWSASYQHLGSKLAQYLTALILWNSCIYSTHMFASVKPIKICIR